MEIGIDTELCERFVSLSDRVKNNTYTAAELEYANKYTRPQERLCAMWCVKEATVKAFSNLKLSFLDIELSHEADGKPYIVLNDTILAELKKNNATNIKVSLSHTKLHATAVVIIC